MNICIYTKKQSPDATFIGRDHIFPGGIGGKAMLPTGYVSDEANNAFSLLELDFMRNSLISLPRQYFGPGKRGRLAPSAATQSNIHIMYGLEMGHMPMLGYISLGIPNIIDQVALSPSGGQGISLHPKAGLSYQEQFSKFVSQIKKWDHTHTFLEEKDLDDVVLLGNHNQKWYIAASNSQGIQKAIDFARLLQTNELRADSTSHVELNVKAHQRMSFNIEYFYRVCAKIAFNYLAFLRGSEYMLKSYFAPIREYILRGSPKANARLMDSSDTQLSIFLRGAFPKDAHKVLISTTKVGIIAMISFYGDSFPAVVNIAETSEDPIYEGFICDWRNSNELSLIEVIRALAQDQEKASG